MQFRRQGESASRDGLDLWFDPRNNEYRGSLVELEPAFPAKWPATLAEARTWNENLRIKKTVQVHQEAVFGDHFSEGEEQPGEESSVPAMSS